MNNKLPIGYTIILPFKVGIKNIHKHVAATLLAGVTILFVSILVGLFALISGDLAMILGVIISIGVYPFLFIFLTKYGLNLLRQDSSLGVLQAYKNTFKDLRGFLLFPITLLIFSLVIGVVYALLGWLGVFIGSIVAKEMGIFSAGLLLIFFFVGLFSIIGTILITASGLPWMPVVAADKNKGPIASIKIAWELFKGNRVRVVIVSVLAQLVVYILTLLTMILPITLAGGATAIANLNFGEFLGMLFVGGLINAFVIIPIIALVYLNIYEQADKLSRKIESSSLENNTNNDEISFSFSDFLEKVKNYTSLLREDKKLLARFIAVLFSILLVLYGIVAGINYIVKLPDKKAEAHIREFYEYINNGDLDKAYYLSPVRVSKSKFKSWYKDIQKVEVLKVNKIEDEQGKSSNSKYKKYLVDLKLYSKDGTISRYNTVITLKISNDGKVKIVNSEPQLIKQEIDQETRKAYFKQKLENSNKKYGVFDGKFVIFTSNNKLIIKEAPCACMPYSEENPCGRTWEYQDPVDLGDVVKLNKLMAICGSEGWNETVYVDKIYGREFTLAKPEIIYLIDNGYLGEEKKLTNKISSYKKMPRLVDDGVEYGNDKRSDAIYEIYSIKGDQDFYVLRLNGKVYVSYPNNLSFWNGESEFKENGVFEKKVTIPVEEMASLEAANITPFQAIFYMDKLGIDPVQSKDNNCLLIYDVMYRINGANGNMVKIEIWKPKDGSKLTKYITCGMHPDESMLQFPYGLKPLSSRSEFEKYTEFVKEIQVPFQKSWYQ